MKIFLEFPNKNVFSFQVSNNDKILKLKNEINKLFGSILQEYILTYDDLILKDDKTWNDYKIEEKSLIITDRGENRIFVETMNEMSLGLKLDNLTIFELMKKVQEKIGIARGDQILIYDNELLEDGGKLLREFGISGNSVIRVLDRSRGEISIFVKIMDENKFVMEVQKSDKIIDLKYKIQGKVGLHPDEQILSCIVEMFDEYKTIDEYQISDKSVINVICQFRCGGMQLFAKTMDGKQVTLEAQKSDKIINIKYEIKYKTGLSPDKQILIYKDKILENDKTIDQYQICDISIINIVDNSKDGMAIFTRTEDGQIDLIRVQGSDKIIDIKYKIQENTRLHPDFQKLKNRGRILENDKTIDEYQITEESVINIILQLRGGGMTIFGRTIDGKTFSLDVEKSYKISDIKYKFIDKAGLRRDKHIYIYQGKTLDDDNETIDKYQIRDQSIINIVPKLEDEMNIFAKLMEGNLFPLNVQKSDKIIDIKYKIQDEIGLSPDKQILIYQEEILNDYITIDEYRILDQSVINIVTGWRGGRMGIFVKIIDGKTVAFEVQYSDKIIDIKTKIKDKLRLPINDQILIYQDEILKNDKTVDFYQIFENSVINMVARLRGRMQIFAKTMDESLVPIAVQKSDKIINVKKKIKEKIGLHLDEQELIYQGKILDDDNKSLDQYQISDKYMINVIARWRSGGIGIFVKVINKKTITIEVQLYERIANIKKKIQDKTGLNSDAQKLVYQGEILDEDNKTIDEYGIYDQSMINVFARLRHKISIFAEIINGKILTFTMPINSTIFDVKNEINRKLELTKNDEILIYHDNILDDNDYCKLINLYKSDMIFILTIRSKYEKSFIIDLSKHVNIRKIRKSIKSKLNIYENYEKIIFNDKQILINENKVIYSYEIVPRSIIDLDSELREFRLFIQSIKKGLFDDVKKYFQKEFLGKKHGSYLRYPIHYAVRYGHLEIINYLINQQCNIESVDFENIRPIHYACYYGTGDILKLFIENKCDLESSDLLKRRPIHFACYHGKFEIINLLIKNRCELEIKDLMKQTPLKIVRKKQYFQSTKIIEEEIENIKMDKIAIRMNLKCTNECDHKNCCISFFRSLLDKNFDKNDRIGKGNFGKVYKCQEPLTGAKFAVKNIDKNKNLSKYIENNINNFTEILIHPRIIQYFGAVEKEKKLFIFMELLSENSLKMKIIPSLSPHKVIHYTKQMLEALKFLHERNIIHRDIKPENSILKDEDNLKLIDFGLSLKLTQVDGITENAGTFCGTSGYIAPEIINGLYTCSVDIWSLGVSVVYMATGKLPSFDFWSKIKKEYQLPDDLPPYFKDLINGMLIQDPKKRLSAEQLLEIF